MNRQHSLSEIPQDLHKLIMSLRTVFLAVALLFVLLVPIALRAASPAVPSSPPERVVDLANIIEPDLEAQLVSALRELEEKTTAQMAVLTVSSLDGETIEVFSLRTAEQWKLGQKGKDNGLLLTVALKERKYRFETGYGLESVLPDSFLGSLGRRKMVPLFKDGRYGEGIAAATKELLAVLGKNYQIQIGGAEQIPLYKPFAFKIFSFSSRFLTPLVSTMIFIVIFTSIVVLSLKKLYGIVLVILALSYFSMVRYAFFLLFAIYFIFLAIAAWKKWIELDKSNYDSDSDGNGISFSSSSSSDDSSSSSSSSGGGGSFGGGGSSGSW